MKTYLHDKIIERILDDTDSVVEDVLRLASAAKRLLELYPDFRDDPSDEDLLAWMELDAASNIFLGQNEEDIKREQDREEWLEEQEERLGKGNYHDA